MHVLVIGSDTAVGRDLLELLLRRGRQVEALATADCRWKSERQTKKALVRSGCQFVVDTRIEAAARSSEPIRELDLNRSLWLAKSCQKNKLGYFHLSSSQVFSGDLTRLYTEEDYPDSTESIGELLLRVESSIRDHCERHLILRFGPVFSHAGENVLTDMLKRLLTGETLSLPNHKRCAPVSAADAARVISGLLDQFSTGAKDWGIYHYCSSDTTNCYEFAEVLLASASQFSELSVGAVERARSENAPTPLNRTLDCSKVRNNFAIKQMPWRGSIPDMVKQYFESHKHLE